MRRHTLSQADTDFIKVDLKRVSQWLTDNPMYQPIHHQGIFAIDGYV